MKIPKMAKIVYRQMPGADLEIKRGCPSSRTSVSAGGLGGTVSPQWVQGKVLVGAQGAKPPEAPRFRVFSTLKIP